MSRSPHAASVLSGTAMHRAYGRFGCGSSCTQRQVRLSAAVLLSRQIDLIFGSRCRPLRASASCLELLPGPITPA